MIIFFTSWQKWTTKSFFKNPAIVSSLFSKVVVSKPPEVIIQTEDKQCDQTLEQIEPHALESGGYDDFENDWNLHSTGGGDLQQFATKNDIKRLELQQEVILANQNLILENLRGKRQNNSEHL